jgi:hypothetical protein
METAQNSLTDRVSVLFVSRNSVYKTIPGLDVWDEDRNALKWPGGNALIAHPPCRLWCTCKEFSNAPLSEMHLAIWAVDQVQHWGGILEHPARSTLWPTLGLPRPGSRDAYGLTIAIDQWWWDHKARKPTWLYICGVRELPKIPLKIVEPTHLISNSRASDRMGKRLLSRQARSATPVRFARWLVETAQHANN